MFKNFVVAAFALVLGATAANATACAPGTNWCPSSNGTGLSPSSSMTPAYDQNGHQIEGGYVMDDEGGTIGVLVMRANGDLQAWNIGDAMCDNIDYPYPHCGTQSWNMTWHTNTGGRGATQSVLAANTSMGVWKGNPQQGGTALWGAGTINKCLSYGGPWGISTYDGIHWVLSCNSGGGVIWSAP